MKRQTGWGARVQQRLPVLTLIGTQLMAAAVFWMALPFIR